MEFNVQTFIDQVTDEQYEKQTVDVSQSDLSKVTVIKKGIVALQSSINDNRLAQYEWQFDVKNVEDPISVRLETGIINLPFENGKTISKILNVTDTLPVNVYLICESPELNRSGLRIDRLASATALADDPDSVTTAAMQWIDEQLTILSDNLANKDEK
ncbi:hypothetical protein ABTQ33_02480 [Paucilactobacillus suebicus]|uniref:Uncharacterized protein n=1 Tax=Paucilactobacillus suebicus DSM 5007 = KCTC 3549 TaxID=1423807 RepID=A0A0R1W663_9LACO|nr:hypothetical protein [Paucilactobacillus suebicus]KRM12962.1 hypothetical protein FD16_GL001648 [Paucilactobacillus suebicus DSM 5007 = KCTC 3549]